MQATIQPPQRRNPFLLFLKGIFMFLLFPLIAAVLLYLLAQDTIETYQQQHENRIFTGVSVWNHDVSRLTRDEASQKLQTVVPMYDDQLIALIDPVTGQRWSKSLAQLGVSAELDNALAQAFEIGRTGSQQEQLREQALVWYHGTELGGGPRLTIDETPTDNWILAIADQINLAPTESELLVEGLDISYSQAQTGRQLNATVLREEILTAVYQLEPAEIILPTSDLDPAVRDYSGVADAIQAVTRAPITFYFDKPVDGTDLANVTISAAQLSRWMKIDISGDEPMIALDEQEARNWVAQFAPAINREPERARFYFDDFTSELVLIEPHINGRQLNIDATLEQLLAAVQSDERTIPFVIDEIVPTVHSNVTGAELGITQELTRARRTTSFAGSPPERRHNIARVSQNYYGVIVAPGEDFSFNQLLDALTEENGYVEGLIIAGGQTQREVGGGICQVSTTIFQSAFWGGFALGDRLQHSYRVGYYENDPFNPDEANIGMDATIYKPLVDFTFTNNTPHHLLIENYYDGVSETMTVKFYSTDIGRSVEMDRAVWNETDQLSDKCIYNPELEEGEISQVEWGIGGASVLIERYVYNYLGQQREYLPIESHYTAMRNVYEYGPGVDPNNVCIPPRAPQPQPTAEPTPAPES